MKYIGIFKHTTFSISTGNSHFVTSPIFATFIPPFFKLQIFEIYYRKWSILQKNKTDIITCTNLNGLLTLGYYIIYEIYQKIRAFDPIRTVHIILKHSLLTKRQTLLLTLKGYFKLYYTYTVTLLNSKIIIFELVEIIKTMT